MSGCCGPSPVVISQPAAPRLDVEGSLLCDVLADGTIAGQALVEAVYDTSSGARVGTRTVYPATGTVYTPLGTLQPCPPPDSCTCEALLLCDVTTVTTPGETPERIVAGDFPDVAATNAAWVRTGGASWVNPNGPDGAPGFLDFSGGDTPPGSITQTVTVTPGLNYAFSAHFGTWNGGGSHQQTGRVEIFDGGGALLFTQDVAPTIGPSGVIWPPDGVMGPVNIVATDGTMRLLITDISANPGQTDLIVDDISLLGPGTPDETTTTATPFLRTICRTCTGAATVTDTALDGTTIYDVQGTVGVCGPPDSPGVFQHQEVLCDVTGGATETIDVPFGGAGGTLANGVTWTHTGTPAGVQIGPGGGYRIGSPSGPNSVSFDQPVEVLFDVDAFTAGVGQIPAGATLVSLRGAATYDPATRELTVLGAGDGGTFRLTGTTGFALSNSGGTLLWRNFAVTAAPVVTRFIRKYIEDAAGAVTSTVDINLDGETYDVQGVVMDCAAADTDEGCAQVIGTLCYQEPTTQDPLFTLHKFNDADPNHPGCLVGLDSLDGDFPFIQYNDPITSWEGTYSSNTGTASNLEVSAPELGGFIDWSAFSPPIPSVPDAGIPAPYTGTAVFNGVTVTLEIFTEQALTTGTQYLRLGGSLHFKLSFSSPVTMKFGTQGFADPAPGNDERFCNVTATGVVTGAGEIRTAYGLRDCKTGETTWLDQVSGDTVDLTQTVVVPCSVQRDCASPTEPIATVGLCLADGTPIAVTVVRDCAGTITSEGWLNLTTGAWSAGAVPAGTVACGDSRSIQVAGTFCDVLPGGTVAGLVLVEYSYDDTGAISSVRLVDAVTGGTYIPQGTVTTCPAGVEQPEQDIVQLCDVAADGTSTPFIRDYRRDELGAIVGHTDYLLDGTPYPATTGTVGVCAAPDCGDTELIELCDTVPPQQPPIPPPGGGFTLSGNVYNSAGTLVFSEGQVPVTGVATGTAAGLVAGSPYEFTYQAGWNGTGGGVTPLPEALYLLEILDSGGSVLASRLENLSNGSVLTGPLSVRAPLAFTAPSSGTVTIRITDRTTEGGISRDLTFRPESVVSTLITVVPFVRAVTYGCDGAPDSSVDFLPDGVTAYQVLGTVGKCATARDCNDCESQILCDGQADDAATIRGANVSSGTMSNGIAWTSTSGATSSFGTAVPSEISNVDGAWWGNPESFPLTQVIPYRFTLSRPTVAEFSVFFIYSASSPTFNVMQLPPNVTPVFLPPGWSFDAGTSRVTVGPGHGLTLAQQTALMASPDLAHSPRFRTLGPVTEFVTTWLGSRYAFQGAFRTSWTGAISTVPSVPFLRTICRDCTGVVTATYDTTLDGSAAYIPSGVVGLCPDTSSCEDCETIVLCDDGGDDPAVIRTLNASQQTLSNGVAWTVRGDAAGPAGAVQSKIANADGAWWGNGEAAPNTAGTVYTIGASTPVTVEFSVHLAFDPTPGTTANCVQLPLNVEPVDLPTGYAFDPATGRLCVTAEQDQTSICSDMANPTRLRAARLRTISLTTSVSVDWLGTAARTVCGVPRTLWVGAIEMTPPGQFMRRICHTCDGTVTSVVDTLMDGATSYTLRGAAVLCQVEPCCEPVQICVTPRSTGEVQFVSNPDKRDDGTVADTFTWAPSGGGSDPSAVTTWYPMYNKRYPGTAWQTVDSATRNNGQLNSPTAGWIAPHAGAMVVSTGLPGEGPPIANPSNWWARSSFTIPAAADLSTVKMEITALNADQVPVRYRINNGDWVNGGGFYSAATPYRQAPVLLTGAVAGENFLYFEVNENAVQPDASNGAGVIAHFILTYAVPGQASWTKMVCCSGDVYYLDQFEQRHESLPDGARIIPCTQEQPVTLCDDNGTFIRWVQDLDGTIATRDTDLDGAIYIPEGEVGACAGPAAEPSDQYAVTRDRLCVRDLFSGQAPRGYVYRTNIYDARTGDVVSSRLENVDGTPYTPAPATTVVECQGQAADTTVNTGIERYTNDTAPQSIGAAFPGWQSVTLTVLAGAVQAVSTGGTATIPAGVSLTWSVTDVDDTALNINGIVFTGEPGSDYLLSWTYKDSAAG